MNKLNYVLDGDCLCITDINFTNLQESHAVFFPVEGIQLVNKFMDFWGETSSITPTTYDFEYWMRTAHTEPEDDFDPAYYWEHMSEEHKYAICDKIDNQITLRKIEEYNIPELWDTFTDAEIKAIDKYLKGFNLFLDDNWLQSEDK